MLHGFDSGNIFALKDPLAGPDILGLFYLDLEPALRVILSVARLVPCLVGGYSTGVCH